MYKALIRSLMEYSSTVFHGASQSNLQKFEIVQKIATRIICGMPRDAHAAPLMYDLGLETLSERRIEHTTDLVSKCCNGIVHPSMKDLLTINTGIDGVSPYTPSTVIGNRAFSIIGRKYNSLHIN